MPKTRNNCSVRTCRSETRSPSGLTALPSVDQARLAARSVSPLRWFLPLRKRPLPFARIAPETVPSGTAWHWKPDSSPDRLAISVMHGCCYSSEPPRKHETCATIGPSRPQGRLRWRSALPFRSRHSQTVFLYAKEQKPKKSHFHGTDRPVCSLTNVTRIKTRTKNQNQTRP